MKIDYDECMTGISLPDKIEKIRNCLIKNHLEFFQAYGVRSTDDDVKKIYDEDGVEIYVDFDFGYADIIGLTREEECYLDDIVEFEHPDDQEEEPLF